MYICYLIFFKKKQMISESNEQNIFQKYLKTLFKNDSKGANRKGFTLFIPRHSCVPSRAFLNVP